MRLARFFIPYIPTVEETGMLLANVSEWTQQHGGQIGGWVVLFVILLAAREFFKG